jgi:hypothetical protein
MGIVPPTAGPEIEPGTSCLVVRSPDHQAMMSIVEYAFKWNKKFVYKSQDINRAFFKNKGDRNSKNFSLHPPVLTPRIWVIGTCEPIVLELFLWRCSGRNVKLIINLRVYFHC